LKYQKRKSGSPHPFFRFNFGLAAETHAHSHQRTAEKLAMRKKEYGGLNAKPRSLANRTRSEIVTKVKSQRLLAPCAHNLTTIFAFAFAFVANK